MSLPSQTARTSPAGRSFVYRKRRSRRRPSPIIIAGGILASVVLITAGLRMFGPSWGSSANGQASESSPTAMVDPLITEPLPEPDPDAGALVISQGAASDELQGSRTGTTRHLVVAQETTDSVPAPPPVLNDRGMLDEALAGGDSAAPVHEPISGGDNSPAQATTLHLDAADELLARNDPLAARQALWDAMRMPGIDELELSVLRGRLTEMNNQLVFGPAHIAGDPLSEIYTVKPGDALSRIARSQHLLTHWRLIQRINGISSPERIRVGQRLKIIRGPFHAIVDKSDFRLDLFQGEAERPETWVYIRSFDVGLGEGDSTPIGHFIVRPGSKLENPSWVNPRNPSEKYSGDDPDNPIGEFWIGLDGLGDAVAYAGYGLHGTIEPDSIGQQRSMGCVRLRPDDIALLYECLAEGESLVRIRR